jgi:VWFA-related protein
VRHNLRRAALAIALAGSAAVRGAGQTPAQDPPQQRPTFRVESNFVRVDVYPLRGGKPILDLRAEDFEVYEDGALQKIESFEHVVVRPAGPQEDRVEVSSQRESLQAAANPRNRVFVIFLDIPHVSISSAHAINEPLIRLLDRILSPDDLVAVMTPAMAASQIVLGRKTQVIEDSLRKNWAWGQRFTFEQDDRERSYTECYPKLSGERGPDSELAKEMIRRKRERATLDALQDLVRYLRTIREERKAIITVTEGWLLYGPNPRMTDLRKDGQWQEAVPSGDPVVVGPNGKLTTRDERKRVGGMGKGGCDGDRMLLAHMDNQRFFRDILEEANRANASFYPIDPRGLPAADNPIGPEPPPPVTVDQAMLKTRIESLKVLAANTDGIAVVDNNDLDRGLKRISDDLTSYYLLGYYSSNSKLDGRFRTLKVKVKQPGVEVRARSGYRAATEAEVTAARTAADAPVPEVVSATRSAIDRLSRIRPEARFRINVSHARAKTLWVAGELQSPGSGADEFAAGGTVTLDATSGGKTTTTKVELKAGERSFLTPLELHGEASEAIDVRARVSAAGAATVTDNLPVDLSAPTIQPLLFRRGPSTGNKQVPAADFRFSRTERLHLEIPVADVAKPGAGRLLDRAGQPLQVPVIVGERTDAASGQRWITADITLAPLSAGDYAIEVVLQGPTEERVLTGVRVTR